MAQLALRSRPAASRDLRVTTFLWSAAAFAAVGVASFLLIRELEDRPILLPIAFAGAIAVGAVCVVSERYTLTLGGLMLFLGLADGYLKLRFQGLAVTGLRDALLFAIMAGALMRIATSDEPIRWPPLTGLVVAWLAVVGVQLANPANGTLQHSVLALRSHIEWVPLFFFGFVMMRTKGRLFGFLVLLLVLTAINGLVSLYQYQAGPEAIAAWGPGYYDQIFGAGDLAGRTFVDSTGEQRIRPPGLGSDTGFAGILAVLGGPAAFVFLMLGRRRAVQALGVLLAAGVLVAVLVSQVRIAIVGLLVSGAAVILLSAASRRLVQAVAAAAVVAAVGVIAVSFVSGSTGGGVFDRYATLQGNDAVSNTTGYKSGTLALLPSYMRDHPFGQGIGSVGPAASIAGAPEASRSASGESEFNFLLVEVGIPGLIVLLALQLTVIARSVRTIRLTRDPELRLLLAALLAPLIALLVLWFGGPVSSAPPSAPYIWFVTGVLAYWCFPHAGKPPEAVR